MPRYTVAAKPQWLSIEEIARLLSRETGRSAAELERDLEGWFGAFVSRYTDPAGAASSEIDATNAMMGLIGGRQIHKSTLEAYCAERNLPPPRFWSNGQAAAPAGPRAPRAAGGPRMAGRLRHGAKAAPAASPTPPAPSPVVGRAPAAGRIPLDDDAVGAAAPKLRAGGGPGAPEAPAGPPLRPLRALPEPLDGAPAEAVGPATRLRLLAMGDALRVPRRRRARLRARRLAAALAVCLLAAAGGAFLWSGVAPDPGSDTVAQGKAARASSAPEGGPADPRLDPASPGFEQAAAEAKAKAPTSDTPAATEGGGQSDALVFLIQQELLAAGFDPGPLSGRMGPRSLAALKDYQTRSGMPADGLVSLELLYRLAQERLVRARETARSAADAALGAAPGGSAGAGEDAAPAKKAPPTPVGLQPEAPKQQPPALDGSAGTKAQAPASTPQTTGNLALSVQLWLKMAGFDPGPVDGKVGPQTRKAILRYQRGYGLKADGQASPALLNHLEVRVYERRALERHRVGDYEAAIHAAAEIIKRSPQNAEGYFQRGRAEAGAGRLDRAVADYETAIALNPGHARAYAERGAIQYRRGRYRGAVEDYVHAIKAWLSEG